MLRNITLENIEVGDTIVRHTNAKRIIQAIIVINHKVYVVSRYLSSSKPRIDTLSHLQKWKWKATV